jgi:hypothetical protein
MKYNQGASLQTMAFKRKWIRLQWLAITDFEAAWGLPTPVAFSFGVITLNLRANFATGGFQLDYKGFDLLISCTSNTGFVDCFNLITGPRHTLTPNIYWRCKQASGNVTIDGRTTFAGLGAN